MSSRPQLLPRLIRSELVRRTYGAFLPIPGVGKALQKLTHTWMPSGTRFWVRIPTGAAEGLCMHADLRIELGYARGTHEPWLQDILTKELKPGDCFYDLGAHTGFFALIAARQVGPSGAVFAVEADSDNAANLRVNAARNGFSHLEVLESAVWSAGGFVTFEPASESTQGHVASAKGQGTRSVRAVSLDELVFQENRRAPAFIKMDVEGAEWEVLQGAHRLFAEAKPKLLCEVHHPEQSSPIQCFLSGYGYDCREWKPVDPNYPTYQQLYIWAVRRT